MGSDTGRYSSGVGISLIGSDIGRGSYGYG